MPDPVPITLTTEALQQIVSNAVLAAATVYQAQGNNAHASQAEKPKRPTIGVGTTLEKWNYFKARWERYKSMTNIQGAQIVSHLLECCDEELQLILHRLMGSDLTSKTEKELLEIIQKYAVTEENVLICRNILRGMTQNYEEDVRHFAARVKGQAEVCNYTVKCTKTGCDEVNSYAEEEIKDQGGHSQQCKLRGQIAPGQSER